MLKKKCIREMANYIMEHEQADFIESLEEGWIDCSDKTRAYLLSTCTDDYNKKTAIPMLKKMGHIFAIAYVAHYT